MCWFTLKDNEYGHGKQVRRFGNSNLTMVNGKLVILAGLTCQTQLRINNLEENLKFKQRHLT